MCGSEEGGVGASGSVLHSAFPRICLLFSHLFPLASPFACSCISYDIEDAIVMNRASLDRGFGRCIVLRKYGTSLKKYGNRTQDRIVLPAVGGGTAQRPSKYRVLDADGIASAGEVLSQGELLWCENRGQDGTLRSALNADPRTSCAFLVASLPFSSFHRVPVLAPPPS